MSLPQTPYLLTSGTCNPNFLLVSLDHTVRVTQRYLHFHRDLVLTGCGLTQLFSEVLFSLGSYLHYSLSWQKKSPLQVPWGTGIDVTRSQGTSDLLPTLHCWTLDKQLHSNPSKLGSFFWEMALGWMLPKTFYIELGGAQLQIVFCPPVLVKEALFHHQCLI